MLVLVFWFGKALQGKLQNERRLRWGHFFIFYFFVVVNLTTSGQSWAQHLYCSSYDIRACSRHYIDYPRHGMNFISNTTLYSYTLSRVILFAHFPIYWIGSFLSPSYASIFLFNCIMRNLWYTRHKKLWQSWLPLLLRSFRTLNSLCLTSGVTFLVMELYSSTHSHPLLSNTLSEFSPLPWEQPFRWPQLHSVLPCVPSRSTFLGRL